MQTADFDVNEFMKPNEADKALLVKFFVKPKLNKYLSEQEARPIYEDKEYIDIKIPGKRDGSCHPVTQKDIDRFPEHYKRFKDRVANPEMELGTPLEEWPIVSRSLCEELKFYHVKTVEQLANMADTQASKFRGLIAIREKAKLWLERAEKDKPIYEMDQKLKKLEEQNEELKASIKELVAQISGNDEKEAEAEGLNDRQIARKRQRAVKTAVEKAEGK